MKRLLVLLLFVPSALLAQKDQMPAPGSHPGPVPIARDTMAPPPARSAYSIGIVGYTGGAWQPSGVEFAMLWRPSRRAATTAGATLSLGTFVQQQAVLFGQSRGFYVSLGATLRQPLLSLADLGSDRNPASVRVEAGADLAGSANFNSPLPQGSWDGRAALLLGLAFGSTDPLGQAVGIYFGPAVILGRTASVAGELALRFRLPLGRR